MRPSLQYQLVQLKNGIHNGHSLTHKYLQKKISDNYTPADLDLYLKKIHQDAHCGSEYSQLVLKSIELEKEFSSSHYAFFHGTLATRAIILRTMLEQIKTKKSYENLFLLRSRATTNHLRGITSSYEYTIGRMKSMYMEDEGLNRFDNNDPIKSDLLAVNTSLLASAGESTNEDSISFLDKTSRFSSGLERHTTECLNMHNISNLPENMHLFLNRPLAGLLVVLLPKRLSSLSHMSYPFGVPVGLPLRDLLGGRIAVDKAHRILKEHKEIPISTVFDKQDAFHQARLLMNPDYFQDEAYGIKTFLFLREHESTLAALQDKFMAIRSMVLG